MDVCSNTEYSQYFVEKACSYESGMQFSKFENNKFPLTKIFNIHFSCFMTVSSIPYESQYSTASSAQFADFEGCNSDIEKGGWLNCSLTETCQFGPLVVKCEGMYI